MLNNFCSYLHELLFFRMFLNSVSELDVVHVLLITFREVSSGRLLQAAKNVLNGLPKIIINQDFCFFQTLDTQVFWNSFPCAS